MRIVTAANAMRNQLKILWQQLKSKSNDFTCSSSCILQSKYSSRPMSNEADEDVTVEVHMPITLELNRRKLEMVELFIWICCSFYENLHIPIKDLVIYGMGLNLFKDVHDIFGARDRVGALVETMNGTFNRLLVKDNVVTRLDGEHENQYIQMLDNALAIAGKIEETYHDILYSNIQRRKWESPDWYKSLYALSIILEKTSEHPTDLECPELALLQVKYGNDSADLPVEFFQGMKELQVLSFDVPTLPLPLNLPSNIRALRLKLLMAKDLSGIGGLINLEFLSISTSYLTYIPKQLGQLSNLRWLNFQIKYGDDSTNMPVDFFQGMKELQFTSLEIPSLPQSLNFPGNLQALRLKLLMAKDLSSIGSLLNLEFLSISTLYLTDIPGEMGQLSNLRVLNLRKMNIRYISPGVFSRMLKLEELYLPLKFKRWGCRAKQERDDYDEWESMEKEYPRDRDASLSEIDDGQRINANPCEIASCSLKALEINVPNASLLPKNSSVFKNIQQFKILALDNQPFGNDSINKLQLTGDVYDVKVSGIWNLIKRTNDLRLTKVKNLKNIMCLLGDGGDDYQFLGKMIVNECDELEYLVDTKEKQISFCPFRELQSLHLSMLSNLKEVFCGERTNFSWFENLRQINIRFCHAMKFVFPVSMARGLRQLQSIEILQCNEIEGIFYRDRDDNSYGTYFIEELYFHSLPKLIGFLVPKGNINVGYDDQLSNEDVATYQPLTTNEIVENGTKEPIGSFHGDSQTTSVSAWKNNYKNLGLFTKQLASKKPVSHIKEDMLKDEMFCAFSSKLMEKRLESLKKLKIAFCDSLKVVFSFNGNCASIGALNSLEELELCGLRNLRHVWFRIPPKMTGFEKLQLVSLSQCHNSYLFSSRVAKLLVQLQRIQISRCDNMKEIIVEEEEEEEIMDKIVFPRLKALELQRMRNLMIFYGGIHAIELPLLETLKLHECNNTESFFHGSLNTPMLERIQINGRSYSLSGDLNATMKGLITSY